MSRKNLSRTVIEGGRYFHNKLDRHHSHRRERASTRAWLDHVAVDIDEADAIAPAPRQPVPKRFYDKLAPAHRWLASHVGRPWDKVYAELCATFDRRTLAGRHVVDDHMLKAVDRGPLASSIVSYRRRSFYVDRHGILRRQRPRSAARRAQLLAFAAGRRAGRTLKGWWWFREIWVPPAKTVKYGHLGYLPLGPLSHGEIRRLLSLPAELRSSVALWQRLQLSDQ